MAVYQGIVKHNRVELEGDVRLADGVRVEVRTGADAMAPVDAEEELLQRLRTAGLLEEMPDDQDLDDEPFEPVTVTGQPLSEQIIEERR